MIQSIQIQNFKSIEKESISFKPLTILTGLNSSGKSSVIQSILLFSSYYSDSQLLKHEVKKYSNFIDIRNRYTNAKEIKINIEFTKDEGEYLYKYADKSPYVNHNGEDILIYEENLYYISANRIGQEDIASYDTANKFGIDGKYVYSYYEQNKDKPIIKELIKDETQYTLDTQLSYWLKHILDIDLRIVTQKIGQSVQITFESDGLKDLSPFNLGAGNSYIAKILIIGLSCDAGDIFIIENPEIHLHPKAQSKVADFVVFLANAGVQLIVETHSEHLLNKLRYTTYKSQIKSTDINIYYKASIREEFINIKIDNNGHFINDNSEKIEFPQSFFDATLSELLEMM